FHLRRPVRRVGRVRRVCHLRLMTAFRTIRDLHCSMLFSQRMPELPDITVYLEALESRILNEPLLKVRIKSPFLLRTAAPPVSSVEGHRVTSLRRLGKQIAFGFDNDLWLVLHLMIAGRLHWHRTGVRLSGKNMLAAFDFPVGSLLLTEAGTK